MRKAAVGGFWVQSGGAPGPQLTSGGRVLGFVYKESNSVKAKAIYIFRRHGRASKISTRVSLGL